MAGCMRSSWRYYHDGMVDLYKVQQNLLKIMILMFHHLSFHAGEPIALEKIPKEDFDEYRVSYYIPGAPLVVWTKKLNGNGKNKSEAGTDKNKNSDAVALWKKSIKPNATAYIELKDVAYFSIWKEKMESTAEAQGLGHLLDTEAVLEDMALYKMQSYI